MRRPTSCHRRHHRAGTHHQDTRPPTKPRPASPLNSSFTGARPTPPRSQRPVRRTLNVRDDRQLCASIYQHALCPRAAVREPPTQSSVNRPRPSCWQHHNTADLLSTESSTQSIWGKGRLFFLYSGNPLHARFQTGSGKSLAVRVVTNNTSNTPAQISTGVLKINKPK